MIVRGASGSTRVSLRSFCGPCKKTIVLNCGRPFSCAVAGAKAANQPTASAKKRRVPFLIAVGRCRTVAHAAVVGSFLRNENVMGMTLLNRSAADHEESRFGPQLFDRFRSAITH